MRARLGTPRLHLRRTDSTNQRARALAAAGAPAGTLVSADEQTVGRGRQGRAWTAPAGRAVLMSVVVREPPRLLPLAAAVAVADAVTPLAPAREVAIKWPNDVLLDGRKVAGILVEGRPQEGWAVVGIGVNVAVRAEDLPAELRGRAGSLDLEPDAVEVVLRAVLAGLEHRLADSDQDVVAAWRERDALAGRDVSWADGAGVARGIDDDGRLVVEVANGRRVKLDAGEVHLSAAR
jgi:BirA family biotin operon repressor/biotin-[acetyl-CoA-carboxylase] ligase